MLIYQVQKLDDLLDKRSCMRVFMGACEHVWVEERGGWGAMGREKLEEEEEE